jgi:hypothetical protein
LVHSEDQKGQNKLQLKFDAKFHFREKDSYEEFKHFIRSFGPCRVAILSSGKNTPIECFTTSQWLEFQITLIAWDPNYFEVLVKKTEITYGSPAEALCKLTFSLSLLSLFFSKQAPPFAKNTHKIAESQKLPTPRAHFYIINKDHITYYLSYIPKSIESIHNYIEGIRNYIETSEKKLLFYGAWCFTLLMACLLGHTFSKNPAVLKYLLNSKNLFPLYEHPVLIKLLAAQIAVMALHIGEHAIPINTEDEEFIFYRPLLSGFFPLVVLFCILANFNPNQISFLLPPFYEHRFLVLLAPPILAIAGWVGLEFKKDNKFLYASSIVLFFLFETFTLGALTSVILSYSSHPHLVYQSLLLSASTFAFFLHQTLKKGKRSWVSSITKFTLWESLSILICNLFFTNTIQEVKFLTGFVTAITIAIKWLPSLIYRCGFIFEPCVISAFSYAFLFLLYWACPFIYITVIPMLTAFFMP